MRATLGRRRRLSRLAQRPFDGRELDPTRRCGCHDAIRSDVAAPNGSGTVMSFSDDPVVPKQLGPIVLIQVVFLPLRGTRIRLFP